ncbi:uncharacterized protein LOC106176268 isoform X2 [Lingula anatina]|uniref:Uncharacterized protein LOC106176268 isoform X2 n=1 Tax=Lingula anatina TaxID=7574 RepID=A0A1S3JVB8_LINAN|nr:uncharacterized protein LOC106176268 isoform X2 [Lingula anatina]|eukprot:XP_013414034.1 uncharacterized protein LOC106176268 isoform X2 [Lingula anatina]
MSVATYRIYKKECAPNTNQTTVSLYLEKEGLVLYLVFLKMLPAVDEKSAESGVTVITDSGSFRRDRAEIKASYKKYIIVAVAVVVVVAVAIGGILGAVHISNKAAQGVWKEYNLRLTDKQGKKVDEKVQVDLKDNITVYNVNNEKFHVAMDNSRSLVVYKMEMNDKFACYLTPMNKSEETDSKDVANALEQPNTFENTTNEDNEQKQFVANTSPIKNKSLLSPRMQEFCRNLEAYWLTQKDGNIVDGGSTQTPAGGKRQKRACVRIRYICWVRIRICIRVRIGLFRWYCRYRYTYVLRYCYRYRCFGK